MPIPKDEFDSIEDEDTPDLSSDTTQGRIYRFLLRNAERAFRQREIIDAVGVPEGSVGPTLRRLEDHGLVEHRGRFWAVSDAEHAVATAGALSAAAVDATDGGFGDDEIEEWMETAVEPVKGYDRDDGNERDDR